MSTDVSIIMSKRFILTTAILGGVFGLATSFESISNQAFAVLLVLGIGMQIRVALAELTGASRAAVRIWQVTALYWIPATALHVLSSVIQGPLVLASTAFIDALAFAFFAAMPAVVAQAVTVAVWGVRGRLRRAS